VTDKELADQILFFEAIADLRDKYTKLIEWMQDFIKIHNEQMQFIMETALLASINPELKKRVYLNKRMDELDEMFKNFLTYYHNTPHSPTLKEIKQRQSKRSYRNVL
jgi:hypothetical protein